MDIDEEEILIKKCYTCEQPVYDNLNVVYNAANSMTVLWNKYQIFVYEDTEMETADKIIIPEFHIQLIIVSNNYLVCADSYGNIHLSSLKFKNSGQKNLKIAFQPREQGIKTAIKFQEDCILSLKYDADTYFLCVHRINSDLKLEKKIILICNDNWPVAQKNKEKYILTSSFLTGDNLKELYKIFKIVEQFKSCDLLVISFDKLTVYGCLFSPKMSEDQIMLVKLYCSPAEICNIEIVDSESLYILIGLTMGTVLRLSLNDTTQTPDVVHLNTALYKFVPLKNSLLYTDGVTMWKSENTFSKDIKFTQLFVRNTNDFAKCGDQIICTTFTKLVYKFFIEDKSVYLIPKNEDEYYTAEKLLNNYEYLEKLFQEIDSNNELVKSLTIEQDYITAISLSNRQDVVDKAIKSSVQVFESYDEANTTDYVLTEEIHNYFQSDTWLFLIKITNTNIYNVLNDILSHLSNNIRIHINFATSEKILKSTSININQTLKTVYILIPYNNDITEMNVNIKIVVNMPGPYDKKQTSTVLYSKEITLTSEHFIKTKSKTVHCLKKPQESIQDLIQETAAIQHNSLFNFKDISTFKDMNKEWSFYVKLSNNYEDIFSNNKHCINNLSHMKTSYLIQQWSAEEFLKSKSHVVLRIGKEKLKVKILNDGFSQPLLKVTGCDAKITLNVRNFFANLIYNDYETFEPGKEFISYSFYTATENLQKAVKNCITSSSRQEDILPLMEQFEKNIIGALPL